MVMDLQPIAPSEDAPRDSNGQAVWGQYNWTGWDYITRLLLEWGELTTEFAFSNDGKVISAGTCRRVADAIEAHINELSDRDREWLTPHIDLWRTCGGYEQW